MLIIGILVAIALPFYNKAKESIYDNQAKADLKIIQMAEKGYHIDTGSYYPAYSGAATINSNLKLNLPAGPSPVWNYQTTSDGCGQATRNGDDGRTWYMEIDGEPDSGVCP